MATNETFPRTPARLSALRARVFGALVFMGALACVVLMGWHAFTRGLPFTPDSCVYADVAAHVAAGEGMHRGILMAFQPSHLARGEMAVPLTLYAPLYPLLAGGLMTLGVSAPAALLMLTLTFFGVTLLVLYLLARSLFGSVAALLTVGMALHCGPLLDAGSHAWSETLGMTALLGGFLAIAQVQRAGARALRWTGLAGLSFGLAFTARYALMPAGLFVVACLLVLRRWRHAGAVACGFFVPVSLLLARNLVATGRFLGPARDPSTVGLLDNVKHTLISVFQVWLSPDMAGPNLQLRLLLAALTVCVGVGFLARRGALLRMRFFRFAPLLLLGWAVFYLAFLVAYRTLNEFDPIGPRLVLPAVVVLIPLIAGAVTVLAGRRPVMLRVVAVVLVMLAVGREARSLWEEPTEGYQAYVAASERLQWVRANTTPEDALVGDRNFDLPLFCGVRNGLCFFPSEDPKHHLTTEVLRAYFAPRVGKFNRAYIVLSEVYRGEPVFEDEWRRACGDLVADMVFGKTEDWPGITEVARLDDGYVFAVDVGVLLGMVETD